MASGRFPEPWEAGLAAGRSSLPLAGGQGATQVDEVVTDDAESDPALHPGVASVPTAGQPMTPFQQTDAAFAAGPHPARHCIYHQGGSARIDIGPALSG